jgi:cytochrome c
MRISKIPGAAGIASAILVAGIASPARAQDTEKGKQLYAQCTVCHAITASNGPGPGLAGIVGRKSGSAPGFRYSRAMKAANIVWDEKALETYLADPQKIVPGSVMPFSGVKVPKDRMDLVAYLKTL